MAARSPQKLIKGRTRVGAGLDVDVEDEVRALIYGEPAGAVVAYRVPDADGGAQPPDEAIPAVGGGAGSAAPAIRQQPAACKAGGQSDVLGAQLAAALLGELDPAGREEVLARAAVELSAERARGAGPREGSAVPAAHEVGKRARPVRAAAGRDGGARPERMRICERSIALDDRAPAMPRYRVVIDRGCGDSRSHLEFSKCAPSARGAVAANVSGPARAVSAVNEVEPADRFCWRPEGSCQCTPAAFTNCASGSALDREGWCRECGLQVLPPHAGLGGSGPARRGALVARRLPTRLVRRVRKLAGATGGRARGAVQPS